MMKQIKLRHIELGVESWTDDQLLSWISNRQTDSVQAEKAFDIFYNRYSNYLWKVCSIVCRTHPQALELSKDVHQQTMTKVYLNAKSYDKNISGIKTWLSKIARNEFLNFIKQTKSILTLLDDTKDVNINEVEYNDSPLEMEESPVSKIETAMLKLSEKERIVLTTYMMYYDEDEPNKHLPEKELSDLCNYLKTTPENIRQIKLRALKKVKGLLQ